MNFNRSLRQDLANFSKQSVRDISVSRLEELYAPIVAQRRAQDEANEREFNLNLPHLERVKKILAKQLEEIANEENAHLPVVSYFDAIQVAKSARVSENDIGCRALITMLENTWKKDRTASITSAKFTALTDHFRKNYPRSAVCEVLEKIGESGYMTLECSRLAEIAADIHSQEDYESAILSNCLQSNTPSCKKARQFILALVNESSEPEPEEEEEVGHDVKRFQDLHKELREKKQRGDKIGNTRPFEKKAATIPLEEVYFDVIVEPETDTKPEDDFEDEETIKWIYEELESGNEWAWCQVQVVAKWEDENGHEFEGRSNWLGGCSYRSEVDFTRPHGYYDDMKEEAYQSLQDAVDDSDTGMKGVRPASKKAQEDEELEEEPFDGSEDAGIDEEEFDSEWGKYDSPLAKDLWEKSLEGFSDEELGSTTEAPGTWYALFRDENAILWTDSQGFIYAQQFGSLGEVMQIWEKLEAESLEWGSEFEESEESDEEDFV